MKDYELLDAVGGIDSKFVERAGRTAVKRPVWKAAVPIAACLVVLAGLYMAYPRLFPAQAPTGNAEPSAASDINPVSPGETGQEALRNDGGIYIPAIELPESDVSACMIGLVVYNGHVYTQSSAYSYFGEAAESIDGLTGDYLGRATGSIDVWSSPEEYDRYLASTVKGEVYTVKGYDSDFRLCIRNMVEDPDGEPELWIEFMDRLNDITLTDGKDLFEDRLHVSGRVSSVQWQAHEDWDWGKGNIHEASLPEGAWEAFVDSLDSGSFIDAWMPDGSFYEDRPYSSIFDTPNQTHLFPNMQDGTIIELRLVEGGYVKYSMNGWYFVKMPGEAFDTVYDACGGTHISDW